MGGVAARDGAEVAAGDAENIGRESPAPAASVTHRHGPEPAHRGRVERAQRNGHPDAPTRQDPSAGGEALEADATAEEGVAARYTDGEIHIRECQRPQRGGRGVEPEGAADLDVLG